MGRPLRNMALRGRTARSREGRAPAALQLIKLAAELLQVTLVIKLLALGQFEDLEHLLHFFE